MASPLALAEPSRVFKLMSSVSLPHLRRAAHGATGIAGVHIVEASPAHSARDGVTAAVRIAGHVAGDIAESMHVGIHRVVLGIDRVVAAPGVVGHRLGIADHEGGVPAVVDVDRERVVAAVGLAMQRRVVVAKDRDLCFGLSDGCGHGVVAAPGVRGGRKVRISDDGFDLPNWSSRMSMVSFGRCCMA